jgi:hypothetical protein
MTEDYFKDNSVLNENVDWTIVQPIMIMVQDQYIHPILGTDLFDTIADEIYAGTVSTENETLLNLYLRKVIIYYTLAELAQVLKYRYMNKGVMVRNGENSQPASQEEVQAQYSYWKQKAEWQSERATKFLRENATTTVYADYYASVITSDDILPNSTNFTTSIFLDNGDCNECKDNIYK